MVLVVVFVLMQQGRLFEANINGSLVSGHLETTEHTHAKSSGIWLSMTCHLAN